MSKQPKSARPVGSAKHEMTQSPGKDDVHEQREPDQQKEAVISKPDGEPRPKNHSADDLIAANGSEAAKTP